jgi:siroheme synthase
VSFVTGHADKNGKEPDWRALAAAGHTAVFYMGLARLQHIVERLMEHGASAELPAAIIAQGTLPQQRVIAATLATLSQAAARAVLESPVLLVVGEVAGLHASLAWFGAAPGADVSQTG